MTMFFVLQNLNTNSLLLLSPQSLANVHLPTCLFLYTSVHVRCIYVEAYICNTLVIKTLCADSVFNEC